MTTRKTPSKPAAVAAAEKKASIPKRPVIQHTKLFRAELQVALREKNAALAVADRDLAIAASERDEALEANRREYEAKDALAVERFKVIRAEVDADRDDILRTIAGIEKALEATGEASAAPSNVVAMAAE